MKLKRTIVLATISALAATGAFAGAVGVTAPASADPSGLRLQAHHDLGLTVIPCDTCVRRPLGIEPGDHIGEFLVQSGTLADHTGRTIGRFGVHILGTTVATNNPPEVQLTGTLSLPTGQITFQGIEEPAADGATVAITGGTGRYRHARGELRYRSIDETNTELEVTLH
jgi:hypothetical protein